MKLRVVHIITQLELGGAQRNTLYTTAHLGRDQFEPFLLCGRGGILDREIYHADYPTHFIHALVRPLRPWLDLLAFYQLYVKLRELRPHIVHTHSSKAGILGRLAAYVAGVPVIVHTFHGFGFNNRQKAMTRWLFVMLERACAFLSTHLIFVSEANQREAESLRLGSVIPKSIIRSGILFNKEPATPYKSTEKRLSNKMRREMEQIPGDSWRVVYLGNFKPQKNPLDLARVAAIVVKQNPNIHFVLAGDGELRESVERYCEEQHIRTHVHFLGWCKRREDIQDILGTSHCFVMTSLWEGLPRALVEAMASGLPAVVNQVDGTQDIVVDGETGFLIAPGDVERAAEKILWLAEHRGEAVAMGKKAKTSIGKDFDIDHMVHQQEVLYTRLYAQVPLKDYYEPLWGNTQI